MGLSSRELATEFKLEGIERGWNREGQRRLWRGLEVGAEVLIARRGRAI
jgi:hypothetical protein